MSSRIAVATAARHCCREGNDDAALLAYATAVPSTPSSSVKDTLCWLQIIKGQYTPVPATRSKELRDMIDRMLTLSWEKRPSINDILALPVMKQRITKFLSATLQVPHNAQLAQPLS
jgi:serine/threonine protein kinase